MNRRKFIGTCACCAFASAYGNFIDDISITSTTDNTDHYLMKHVEVHLAEHCNLSCNHCCHFSSIAKKEFYALDKFKQDMTQLSNILDKNLFDFHILGGEPLLNPKINEYVKHSRYSFPKTRISLITNAILLNDMNEKFWKTLNENSVNIIPSLYPIKINWESIFKKAEKYNVGIYNYYDCKEKLTTDYIKNHHKVTFYRMTLNEKGYNGIDKSKCPKRRRCNNLFNGKLYPCYFIAYVRHLNKKFGTKFKVTEKDYLDIYKVKSSGEIEKFLKKTRQYPFCEYCSYDFSEVKWENSSKHSLDEWVEGC